MRGRLDECGVMQMCDQSWESSHLLMLPPDPLTSTIPARQAFLIPERVAKTSGNSCATAFERLMGWLPAGRLARAAMLNILRHTR